MAEFIGCALNRHSELKDARKQFKTMDSRLQRLDDALEASGDFYDDLRGDLDSMTEQLQQLKGGAGRKKAQQNFAFATTAVLHLSDTFDKLDVNSSGGIDVNELRRGLHLLGLDSHSKSAESIIQRYSIDHKWIDVKTFTTLVRDIHLLLQFDRDGSGTLDAEELQPALAHLGLKCSTANAHKIVRAWDADNSGKLDLLEFTDLVRSLQTFSKYDKDGSGDIEVEELRPALRRLGLPADTETANSILKWYDADMSGRIELHEFAVLARDVAVFTAFDADHSGTLEASELGPALTKLGLAPSEAEVRRIIETWDDNEQGSINIIEFSEIVRDLQVFEQFDVDRSGFISTSELRNALSKLGVHLDHHKTGLLLAKYDTDKSGTIEFPEFRKLADDLPNLIGRSKGSFFQMHHFDSAYVHAEDILDEGMHLGETFGQSSSKKVRDPSRDAPSSVFGAVGVVPTTFEAALTPGAATGGAEASNPFDSRSLLASGMQRRGGGAGAIRPVNLHGADVAPTLHVSGTKLRD